METEDHVDGRVVEHAVGDHRLGPFQDLLGRLEDELDAALDALALFGQHHGDAEENGGVHVVAAGMGLARDPGGEREAALFLDG